MKRRWPKEIKIQALKLRINGATYGQLNKKFGVSKSTLHDWIKKSGHYKPFSYKDKVEWAKINQPLAVKANIKKKQKKIKLLKEKVQNEINQFNYDKKTKKAMLSMLYWTEGSKGKYESMRFANTDPKLMLLFVTLLRDCFTLNENKFRVLVYLHHYHDELKVKNFWSNLLNIPKNQFNKTYHKARNTNKTFRRNFAGICFVIYHSVDLKDELLIHADELTQKLIGKFYIPVA